jgi:hypothetical protein
MTSKFASFGTLVAAGVLSALAGQAFAQTTYPEIEPNESKAAATAVGGAGGIVVGDKITGSSTGALTGTPGATSADYFRVKVSTAPAAIYQNRLTLSGTLHTISIRGLQQSAGVASTSELGLVTNSGSTTPRYVQWYGFGKGEEFFLRMSGTSTTTAPYEATYSRSVVTPIAAPTTFAPGNITISGGAGNANDTDFWVYDGSFNAIPGAGNDDNAAGATGSLTRSFTPGTYYIAYSTYDLCNNQTAATDDAYRSGGLTDFANIVVNSDSFSATNMSVQIADGAGTTATISGSKTDPYQVVWYTFTVAVPANPTGTASTNPPASDLGTSVTITVNTLSGQPASAVNSVVANLSAYPPLTTLNLVQGPANVWTGTFNVPAGTTPGNKTIPVTIKDALNRTGTASAAHIVNAAALPGLRVSRAYGAGGFNDTTPEADYVEIYNGTGSAQSLAGYTLQIAGPTGTAWTKIDLSSLFMGPNSYALIRCEDPAGFGTVLPTPDITNALSPLFSVGGKVAITRSQLSLTGTNPSADPTVVDFVGYGTADAFLGAAAGTGINSFSAIVRNCGGLSSTGNNAADFVLDDPNGARNSASPTNSGLDVQVTSINPNPVSQDGDVLLVVSVTDCLASGAPILGGTVTLDTTPIGGTGTVTLFDNGTNGDATPNDGQYSLLYRVPATAPAGLTTLTFLANQGVRNGSGTGTIAIRVATVGACCNGSTCTQLTQRQCTEGGGTFIGGNISCASAPSKFFDTETFLPAGIPDGTGFGIVITLTVPPSETAVIDQLQVVVDLAHTWMGDIYMDLTNDGLNFVTLMDTVGDTTGTGLGDSSNLDGIYTFADSGSSLWTAAAAGGSAYVVPSGTYAPAAALTGGLPTPSLALYNGQPFAATWELFVADQTATDTGTVRGFRIQTTATGPTCGGGCPGDYNRDTFMNLDDLGDFITDYYTIPAIPGGAQASAPTYPSLVVGFSTPCPNAPNAPSPYATDAYRTQGYRVGFSPDGSNSCPLSPEQSFPNLDNLGDFITFFYTLNQGPC